MPDLSPAQKQYLFRVRREKYLIHVSRIFLFLGFLLLWEVSARRGWIDSFIFSSPSEIWQTFLRMVQDQSLFTHIGITLMETLVSFAFTVFLGIGTGGSSVVLSEAFADPGALPRRPEQPAKICPRPASDRLARCQCPDDHRCRNVCGDLWLSHQSLHWLPRS